MNPRIIALRIAGTIFGIVALIHLTRIVTVVPVLIGGWLLPVWINYIGALATVFLCYWLWKVSLKNKD